MFKSKKSQDKEKDKAIEVENEESKIKATAFIAGYKELVRIHGYELIAQIQYTPNGVLPILGIIPEIKPKNETK